MRRCFHAMGKSGNEACGVIGKHGIDSLGVRQNA